MATSSHPFDDDDVADLDDDLTTPKPKLPDDVEIAVPFIALPPLPDDDVLAGMIPDVIGEVMDGWRVWNVVPWPDGTVRLQSLGTVGKQNAVIWSPGKTMQAFCPQHDEPPSESHTCGFYAAKTREHLLSMSYHEYDPSDREQQLVLGKVAMSGKIIPGSQGWRTMRARPTDLFVPYSRWRLFKPLQDTYTGVNVTLDNFLAKQKGGDK